MYIYIYIFTAKQLYMFFQRLDNVVVRELQLKTSKNHPLKFDENKEDNFMIVGQSVDWLYRKLYVLELRDTPDSQKKYRIAACDMGKRKIF